MMEFSKPQMVVENVLIFVKDVQFKPQLYTTWYRSLMRTENTQTKLGFVKF